MKNSHLLSQSGFSILQVLIASGLMGVIAVQVMRLQDNSTKIQKTAEANIEFSRLGQRIQTSLLSRAACSITLDPGWTESSKGSGALIIPPASLSSLSEVKLPTSFRLKNKSGSNLFPDNQYNIRNSVSNTELLVQNAWIISDASVVRYPDNSTKLKLTFFKNMRGTTGGKDKGMLFPLNIEYKADNQTFDTCYSSLDNAIESAKIEACEDFGGSYIAGKCELSDDKKLEIVMDGLDLLPSSKKTDMYLIDGVLTTVGVKTYTCQIDGKRCRRVSGSKNCNPCPSGMSSLGRIRRWDRQQGPFNKACMGDYSCKSNNPIGFLIKN